MLLYRTKYHSLKHLMMYFMYVDESGTEQRAEKSRYFVVSGVVVHENYVDVLERRMAQIRRELLPERFQGHEIHVHHIYKGDKAFRGITHNEIQKTLKGLYGSFLDMDFSVIVVVIDKEKWFNSTYLEYDVQQSAYTFLIERFDKYLQRKDSKGLIRIDRTSNKRNVLNAKDERILTIINELRKFGGYWAPIRRLVEPPLFLSSAESDGLQVADAIAYGTTGHLNNTTDFERYYQIIVQKAQKRYNGVPDGYGITIFPKL